MAEAREWQLRALENWERTIGTATPDVMRSLSNLTVIATELGQFEAAEDYCDRMRRVFVEITGNEAPQAPHVAKLAGIRLAQGRYAEAEELWQQAAELEADSFGATGRVAMTYRANWAQCRSLQGKHEEALATMNEVVAALDRPEIEEKYRCQARLYRARIALALGRFDLAEADALAAVELAESQRSHLAGGEIEVAQSFARSDLRGPFELLYTIYAQQGKTPQAFAAAERRRARGLADQMATAGVDLLAGLPAAEADRLRKAEAIARQRVTLLQRSLQQSDADDTSPQQRSQREQLLAELDAARRASAEAYAAIRNASPAYRMAVSRQFQGASWEHLQEWLDQEDALLLYYTLDEFVTIIVAGADIQPRVQRLEVPPAAARALHLDGKELSTSDIARVLTNTEHSGVLDLLADPRRADEALPTLAALWQVLVPEGERSAIAANTAKRIVVIPDGVLAMLPWEALVVEPADRDGGEPKYLLDAGPPIIYAPSATVLMSLADRPATELAADRKPVLTVGDPAYEPASVDSNALNAARPQVRYGHLGGSLARLPYSGTESKWVAEAFRKQGIESDQLRRQAATEAAVRSHAAGRRVLHLACHALADQTHGNLFGALVLAAAPRSAAADEDGYLTLAEIYGLNLRGCELAILSACQTNLGPQQRGEGTWALTRGFLVAGVRRVVTSNWIVDDQASATLIYYFANAVATGEKQRSVDHAAALRLAKRAVRKQDPWRSPFYWAPLVLVGPQ